LTTTSSRALHGNFENLATVVTGIRGQREQRTFPFSPPPPPPPPGHSHLDTPQVETGGKGPQEHQHQSTVTCRGLKGGGWSTSHSFNNGGSQR
jgi:hypothetical protein